MAHHYSENDDEPDWMEAFAPVVEGTPSADFKDGDKDLLDAIERVGDAIINDEGFDMSAFDEATLAKLRVLQGQQKSEKIEPNRRFEAKPELNPSAVRALAPDHPAMVENRTLFPSTVVEVTEDEPVRLLVSGENNRKLGDVVAKGRFKGYALYQLSLEERATCPSDCSVRDICYGNGMQMARRHRIGDDDVFYDRLGHEIAELVDQHPGGVLVRLHVLGDFPSVEYVANWADLLDEWPTLAVYGYTSRLPTDWDGDEIGDAIEGVTQRFPDRFRIRKSLGGIPIEDAEGDVTLVLDHVPEEKYDGAIVCPMQSDATACCATCGLCWEQPEKAIAFIKHGPKSASVQAEAEVAAQAPVKTLSADVGAPVRQVSTATTIKASAEQRARIPAPPAVRLVDPAALRVEGAYQRDLSKKSIKLLRKIVAEWDWAKFKPPICAERDHGLVVIDGQHTAIAAATLGIKQMPALIVNAAHIEARAASFVAHNRDRIAMSPFQIFHASVVAGDPQACAILALAEKTGAIIPRNPPGRGGARAGECVAITEIENCYKKDGAAVLERIFTIAVACEAAPLQRLATRSLRILLTQPYFSATAAMPNSRIANALKTFGQDFDNKARGRADTDDQPADRMGALMIQEACTLPVENAA